MKTNIATDTSPPIPYLAKLEVFYKLILSFWVCVTRHAQSTQYKFVYLAISPEKHWDEVDFFPADKRESSLQIDTIILMGMVKHSQFPK